MLLISFFFSLSQYEQLGYLMMLNSLFLTGEHPGHWGSLHGVVKMPKWARKGERSPANFMRRVNGTITVLCFKFPYVTDYV